MDGVEPNSYDIVTISSVFFCGGCHFGGWLVHKVQKIPWIGSELHASARVCGWYRAGRRRRHSSHAVMRHPRGSSRRQPCA